MEQLYQIYYISLWVCSILFIVIGLDDVFVDVTYWLYRRQHRRSLPDIKKIIDQPIEYPLALVICAWQESVVIERTIRHTLETVDYKNYKIFVGLYPNDKRTIKVVEKIAQEDARVIACLNNKSGPTTKSDNLNNVYRAIKHFEQSQKKLQPGPNGKTNQFSMILVHDSEDFVHKSSLKLYNYLLMYRNFDVAQIPVMPIKDKLGKAIHRTYCDAFAETHNKDLIMRQNFNVFMPLAGTGMAFKRQVFEVLEEKYTQVFDDTNLTEDYELGWRLFNLGYKVSFMNLFAHVDKTELKRIATLGYFPNNFWAAVRQRSRWITGICFQNWKIHKWEGNLVTKYFLMRDRKIIFTSFIQIFSYILFIISILLYFNLLSSGKNFFVFFQDFVPLVLLWVCLVLMIWRLVHRFFFTYHWYGFKYACFSLIRIHFENFINFFATLRAMRMFVTMKEKVIWESTKHY